MRNLYKVLGIAATADDQRIKSAFRYRAKAVHPDLNPGSDCAEARFIELVEAYEVLRRAETRASYDAYLAERRREARRRFAHCAGLMAGSFVLTAASALVVMGLSGANVPLRESWQVAVTALSPAEAEAEDSAASRTPGGTGWWVSVTVPAHQTSARPQTGVSPTGRQRFRPWPVTVAEADAPARPVAADARSTAAHTKAASARSRKAAHEPPAHARRRLAATARRKEAPASPSRTGSAPQRSLWSWLTAPPPERYYGLGASGL